jgi:hypothetical protein
MKTGHPSLSKILWTDYPAFLSSLIVIVAWIVCLAWVPKWRSDGPIVSMEAAPIYLGITGVITLIGIYILIRRVLMIWTIFQNGSQVRGKICKVEMHRDRGRVEYNYIFNHQEYQSGAGVHRNKQTLALKTGERVLLVIDNKNPKCAFIQDLYR